MLVLTLFELNCHRLSLAVTVTVIKSVAVRVDE